MPVDLQRRHSIQDPPSQDWCIVTPGEHESPKRTFRQAFSAVTGGNPNDTGANGVLGEYYTAGVVALSPHQAPYCSLVTRSPAYGPRTTPGPKTGSLFQTPPVMHMTTHTPISTSGPAQGPIVIGHPSSPLARRRSHVAQGQVGLIPKGMYMQPQLQQQVQQVPMMMMPGAGPGYLEFDSSPVVVGGLERRGSMPVFSSVHHTPVQSVNVPYFAATPVDMNSGGQGSPHGSEFSYTPGPNQPTTSVGFVNVQGSPQVDYVPSMPFVPVVATPLSFQNNGGPGTGSPTVAATARATKTVQSYAGISSVAAASANAAALAVAAGFSSLAAKCKKRTGQSTDSIKAIEPAGEPAVAPKPEKEPQEPASAETAKEEALQRTPPSKPRRQGREEGADLLLFLATSPSPARSQLKHESKGSVSSISLPGELTSDGSKNGPGVMSRPHTPVQSTTSTSTAATAAPSFNFNEYLNILTPSPRKPAGSRSSIAEGGSKNTGRRALTFDQTSSPLSFGDEPTAASRTLNGSKAKGMHRLFPSGDLFMESALLYQSRMCVGGSGNSTSTDLAGELLDRFNGAKGGKIEELGEEEVNTVGAGPGGVPAGQVMSDD